jgi:hypothetical protein
LLSGAVCALAVFMAMNNVDIFNIGDIGQMAQANASRIFNIDSPQAFSFQFPQNGSLQDLVDLISRFLDGKQ